MAARKKRTTRKKRAKVSKTKTKNTSLSVGVSHKRISYSGSSCHETAFRRADITFSGVSHGDLSYEVRVFLNNKKATCETPKSVEHGYAGRFVIFGHGGCFGDANHCDFTPMSGLPVPSHTQHPLARKTIHLTVTMALEHVLDASSGKLKSISMVAIKKAPRKKDCGPVDNLFSHSGISLNLFS